MENVQQQSECKQKQFASSD